MGAASRPPSHPGHGLFLRRRHITQKLSGSFAALRDPAGKVTDPESWGGLRQGWGFG